MTKQEALTQGATAKQLIDLYKTTRKTFLKWRKPFDIKPHPETYCYTPAQVKELFEKIGEPSDN